MESIDLDCPSLCLECTNKLLMNDLRDDRMDLLGQGHV